jgi:hypothetical protein
MLRPTVLVSSHLGPKTRLLLLTNSSGFSAKIKGLPFTTAAGTRQHSHSRARVPPDYILLSEIRHSSNPKRQVPVCASSMSKVAQLYPQVSPHYTRSLKNRYNKICSSVPRDLDLRNTTLAMPSKNWKLQTRLLVREGAPHQQTRNCLEIINGKRKIGRGSQMGAWHQDRLADWPSVVI